MDSFSERVLNFIQEKKMTARGESIVVGFSGGADSTALLNVLKELKGILGIKLYALHVNHCIRQQAEADADFAASFCKERDIPFRVVTKDVPGIAKELGLTEEEAGRRVRYEVFEELSKEIGADRIAVAHHLNDVAETLLMNLSRGSGLRGGSAIRPVRERIIRPLLCVTRQEIEQYLVEKNLDFCTDHTNFENDHTRNAIRNLVLPKLTESVNPQAVRHFAEAADSFEKADEYIRFVAKEKFERYVKKEDGKLHIPVKEVMSESEILREYVMLLCFEELVANRKDIERVHVKMCLKLMSSTDGSSSADLPYGIKAERNYNVLSLYIMGNEKSDTPIIPVKLEDDKETVTEVPGLGRVRMRFFLYDGHKAPPTGTYTKWFDYDRIQAVVFRTRRPEDVIRIEQKDGLFRKKIGKFMTDVKIAPPLRDKMYLLADGDEILWIPGYRMSGAYKVSPSTKRVLSVIINDGGNTNG